MGLCAVADIVDRDRRRDVRLHRDQARHHPGGDQHRSSLPKIGESHARALFVTGQRFDAERALRIGLVHEVVADEAALDARVAELLDELRSAGPTAARAAKALVRELRALEPAGERASTRPAHRPAADLGRGPGGSHRIPREAARRGVARPTDAPCDNRDMPDELTPREVADELGVTVRTVQRWIADGRLPADAGRIAGARVAFVARGGRQDAPSTAPATGPIRPLLVANRGEIAVADRADRAPPGDPGHRRPRGRRPPAGRRRRGARDRLATSTATAILASRARAGRRRGPSRLRLPRREPGLRPRRDGRRPHLGRAAAATRSPPWATRPRRAGARPRHGVPIVPGYDGAAQDDATLADRGGADRLSAAGQAERRRRRQGHARRPRRRSELAEALAAARREAHRSLRRRSAHPRALSRGRAPRRGPGAVRRDTGTASTSASATARRSDATRRSSRRRRRPSVDAGAARADGRGGAHGRRGRRLRRCRHGRDAADRCGRVLLPRDEHAPPGRAPGHRGGHRARPRRRPAAASPSGATLAELGLRAAAPVERPRHRGPPLRRGSRGRLPARDRSRWRSCAGRTASGSTPASRRATSVGDRYDPMLAKVIAHGPHAASRRSTGCGARSPRRRCSGVRTNLRFLRWLLDAAGDARRRDADRHDRRPRRCPGPPTLETGALAGRRRALAAERLGRSVGRRMAAERAPTVRRLRHGDEERSRADRPDGRPTAAAAVRDGDRRSTSTSTGRSLEFGVAPPPTVEDGRRATPRPAPRAHRS